MTIFEFTDYKQFIRKRIQSLPNKGRGELTRIAQQLNIHTTMVTHVIKGNLHFSLEQTLKLADHFALNELETEYLVALIQLEKSGDKKSKEFSLKRVTELRNKALNLSARLQAVNELTGENRALYYANANHSYIRMLTAIERFQTFDSICQETGLPPKKVREILDFLIGAALCREVNGKITYGNISTYVETSSPLASRHLINWRLKVQERLDRLRPQDLAFTYATAISESDFEKIREKLVQFIDEFKKTTEPSPSENLYCLNLDWVRISK